jgi:arylamine N-acetyltransferase
VAESAVSEAWVGRYLELLGLAREAPGLDALRRLARAHLLKVPFENVTSILRRAGRPTGSVPPLDAERLLEAWTAGRSGGLCFEITYGFSRLLAALGYQCHPILAYITFPGSHQAVLVTLGEKRYLVDAGNGAPLFEPILLDGTLELWRAGLGFRYHPGANDEWIQDRWIDGAWAPFCVFDLHVPDPEVSAAAYQQHHVVGGSWVVDRLVLVRCLEDEVVSLRDGQLTRFTIDGKSTEPVALADYPRLAADLFALPALPIAEAVAALANR